MHISVVSFIAVLLLITTHKIQSTPVDTTSVTEDKTNSAHLSPMNTEEVLGADLDRNKRKLPEATFEAKNAVLGFVFGSKRHALGGNLDKDDTPELNRTNVSFEFPDELFTKSFRTVTQVSQAFSRLIMNSARRFSRFALFFKPVLGDALIVKGYDDVTTAKPIITNTSLTME